MSVKRSSLFRNRIYTGMKRRRLVSVRDIQARYVRTREKSRSNPMWQVHLAFGSEEQFSRQQHRRLSYRPLDGLLPRAGRILTERPRKGLQSHLGNNGSISASRNAVRLVQSVGTSGRCRNPPHSPTSTTDTVCFPNTNCASCTPVVRARE